MNGSERGVTMIELMIVTVILTPILFAIFSTQKVVSNTVAVNDRRADAADSARNVCRNLRKLIRPGLKSTVRVRATQADVDDATAKEAARKISDPTGLPIYIPSVDEWISAEPNDPRPTIRFTAADGVLAMNAAEVTEPRHLEFVMDAGEIDNGVDDDGDDLVDEGAIRFHYGSIDLTVLEGVESCDFSVNEGAITVRLTVARNVGVEGVQRASIQQTILMRNN